MSRDGRCFTFDARANGFVPGEGVGVILLKRLSDAIRDQDIIHGVIRGWGVWIVIVGQHLDRLARVYVQDFDLLAILPMTFSGFPRYVLFHHRSPRLIERRLS